MQTFIDAKGLTEKKRAYMSDFGYDNVKEYRKARQITGIVPQELYLESFETVWKNVNYSRGLFGKAKNSWFDQHFKPKEEDDETLYRDKVNFFLRMQSKSKSNTIEQDLRSWKKASPYIGSVVERGLVQRKRQ